MAQVYSLREWKARVKTSDVERKLLDVRKFIYENPEGSLSPELFKIYGRVVPTFETRTLTVIMEGSTEVQWLKTPEFYLVVGAILRRRLHENR